MNLDSQHKEKKMHTRNIEISTYEYDEENIIVKGVLKDDNLIPTYVLGEKRQPRTVHHMIIRMLIEFSSLKIKEIKVEMPGFPHDECFETAKSLDAIKGLKVAPGFTSKVIKILDESKRCLHLRMLLFAMAPVVIQGYWVNSTKKPDEAGVPPEMIKDYLMDTCWVWRKDGPLVKQFKQRFKHFSS